MVVSHFPVLRPIIDARMRAGVLGVFAMAMPRRLLCVYLLIAITVMLVFVFDMKQNVSPILQANSSEVSATVVTDNAIVICCDIFTAVLQ